jgi:hypothetical protein
MLEHPLLLGSASLGFFLELNPELGLLRFARAELVLLLTSALFGQAGLLFGPKARVVFFAPPLGFRLRSQSRVFGSPQPCFLCSHDARRLNVVKLQELIRE